MTSEQQELETLLPFYLNGTLNNEEQQRVEQALQSNPDLRQELTFIKSIQQQILQQPDITSPGDLGLKRLQRQINQQQSQATSTPTSSPVWKWTAVAASLMLVVQTSHHLIGTEPDPYQAAGEQQQYQHGTKLTVTFAANISEQQLRDVLLKYDLTIIAGPSALGVYQLHHRHTLSDQTITELKTQTTIFDSVQSE